MLAITAHLKHVAGRFFTVETRHIVVEQPYANQVQQALIW